MPAVLHMVARLPQLSGLPSDVVEMTANVGTAGAGFSVPNIASYVTAFRDFFNNAYAGMTDQLANYIAESVSRSASACQILAYETDDLSGATPLGSPVGMLSFTMGNAGVGKSLPQEVSVVISYNGDLTDVPISAPNPTPPPLTIRPAQRRRGRIFLGPLQDISGEDASGEFRPTGLFLLDVALAFEGMATDINAIAGDDLAVWSKADAAFYPVVGGYIDNAWDTQRRRGLEATSRTTFTIP